MCEYNVIVADDTECKLPMLKSNLKPYVSGFKTVEQSVMRVTRSKSRLSRILEMYQYFVILQIYWVVRIGKPWQITITSRYPKSETFREPLPQMYSHEAGRYPT